MMLRWKLWKTHLLPLMLLFVIIQFVQTQNPPERWWRRNIERITAMRRYALGEDPILLSGMVEGDILPDDDSILGEAQDRNAVAEVSKLWPNGIIPYEFSTGYTALPVERFFIRRAMRDIESKSCLQFVRRTHEEDYIQIVFDSYKCYSNVGRRGGKQVLSLGMFCVMFYDRGNAYHEILHALGFHHEHTRPDRDDHISVNWNNIRSGADKNFLKRPYDSVNVLGMPYDLDSIMHYSPHAFSKMYFLLPTLSSYERGIFFARSQYPSDMDYAKLNRLYGCLNRRFARAFGKR